MNRRGFLLIETLVYIAVLTIISVTFVNMMLSIDRSYAGLGVLRDLDLSAVSIMERITREVRGAENINQGSSVFDTNPGILVLNKKDLSGNTSEVRFLLNGSNLDLVKDGLDTGTLNTSHVSVTNLVFRNLNSGISKAVKVELGLRAINGNVIKAGSYYTTVILRGSY